MFQDQCMDKRASDQVKKKKKNPRSPISTQFKVGPSTVQELTKPAFNLNSTGTEEMT